MLLSSEYKGYRNMNNALILLQEVGKEQCFCTFKYKLLLLIDGVVLRHGNYISAVADIGTFEHSLTTDLLNHLVFVQKVFMKVK